MGKTLNLNRITEDLLDKTIFEILNSVKEDCNNDTIKSNLNSYFKIILKKSIIIGKVHSQENNTIITYSGYYISPNSIKKVEKDKEFIDNAKIIVLTEDKFNELSKEIENLLVDINNFSKILFRLCNTNGIAKIPDIIGLEKPDRYKSLIFDIDDDFIKRYSNKKLRNLRDETLKAYDNLLEDYKENYQVNKKLIGKFFMTTNMIGQISNMGENSCRLYANILLKFETNKLISLLPFDITGISNMFEAPYNVFQNSQDIMFNVKELYAKLLI